MTESETPPAADPAVLRVQRASARPSRRGGDPRAAVSFSLFPGEAHVVAGEPGCGKSALLELIGLARPPARGGIELFGQDLARVRPRERYRLRRRIGFIFQYPRLVEDLTVRDNVALAAAAADRDARDYAGQIDEVLVWVGLGRRARLMAGGLAEDERRRLGVARAVINRPDLLIADEPVGEGGLEVLNLLADLNQAGTTLLMAMHDPDLAARSGAGVTLLSHAPPAQPGGEARGAGGARLEGRMA